MGDWLAITWRAAWMLWPWGTTCTSLAEARVQILTSSLTPPHHSGSAWTTSRASARRKRFTSQRP